MMRGRSGWLQDKILEMKLMSAILDTRPTRKIGGRSSSNSGRASTCATSELKKLKDRYHLQVGVENNPTELMICDQAELTICDQTEQMILDQIILGGAPVAVKLTPRDAAGTLMMSWRATQSGAIEEAVTLFVARPFMRTWVCM